MNLDKIRDIVEKNPDLKDPNGGLRKLTNDLTRATSLIHTYAELINSFELASKENQRFLGGNNLPNYNLLFTSKNNPQGDNLLFNKTLFSSTIEQYVKNVVDLHTMDKETASKEMSAEQIENILIFNEKLRNKEEISHQEYVNMFVYMVKDMSNQWVGEKNINKVIYPIKNNTEKELYTAGLKLDGFAKQYNTLIQNNKHSNLKELFDVVITEANSAVMSNIPNSDYTFQNLEDGKSLSYTKLNAKGNPASKRDLINSGVKYISVSIKNNTNGNNLVFKDIDESDIIEKVNISGRMYDVQRDASGEKYVSIDGYNMSVRDDQIQKYIPILSNFTIGMIGKDGKETDINSRDIEIKEVMRDESIVNDNIMCSVEGDDVLMSVVEDRTLSRYMNIGFDNLKNKEILCSIHRSDIDKVECFSSLKDDRIYFQPNIEIIDGILDHQTSSLSGIPLALDNSIGAGLNMSKNSNKSNTSELDAEINRYIKDSNPNFYDESKISSLSTIMNYLNLDRDDVFTKKLRSKEKEEADDRIFISEKNVASDYMNDIINKKYSYEQINNKVTGQENSRAAKNIGLKIHYSTNMKESEFARDDYEKNREELFEDLQKELSKKGLGLTFETKKMAFDQLYALKRVWMINNLMKDFGRFFKEGEIAIDKDGVNKIAQLTEIINKPNNIVNYYKNASKKKTTTDILAVLSEIKKEVEDLNDFVKSRVDDWNKGNYPEQVKQVLATADTTFNKIIDMTIKIKDVGVDGKSTHIKEIEKYFSFERKDGKIINTQGFAYDDDVVTGFNNEIYAAINTLNEEELNIIMENDNTLDVATVKNDISMSIIAMLNKINFAKSVAGTEEAVGKIRIAEKRIKDFLFKKINDNTRVMDVVFTDGEEDPHISEVFSIFLNVYQSVEDAINGVRVPTTISYDPKDDMFKNLNASAAPMATMRLLDIGLDKGAEKKLYGVVGPAGSGKTEGMKSLSMLVPGIMVTQANADKLSVISSKTKEANLADGKKLYEIPEYVARYMQGDVSLSVLDESLKAATDVLANTPEGMSEDIITRMINTVRGSDSIDKELIAGVEVKLEHPGLVMVSNDTVLHGVSSQNLQRLKIEKVLGSADFDQAEGITKLLNDNLFKGASTIASHASSNANVLKGLMQAEKSLEYIIEQKLKSENRYTKEKTEEMLQDFRDFILEANDQGIVDVCGLYAKEFGDGKSEITSNHKMQAILYELAYKNFESIKNAKNEEDKIKANNVEDTLNAIIKEPSWLYGKFSNVINGLLLREVYENSIVNNSRINPNFRGYNEYIAIAKANIDMVTDQDSVNQRIDDLKDVIAKIHNNKEFDEYLSKNLQRNTALAERGLKMYLDHYVSDIKKVISENNFVKTNLSKISNTSSGAYYLSSILSPSINAMEGSRDATLRTFLKSIGEITDNVQNATLARFKVLAEGASKINNLTRAALSYAELNGDTSFVGNRYPFITHRVLNNIVNYVKENSSATISTASLIKNVMQVNIDGVDDKRKQLMGQIIGEMVEKYNTIVKEDTLRHKVVGIGM